MGTWATWMALLLIGLSSPALAQPPESIRPISTVTDGFYSRYNTVAHAVLNREAATSEIAQEMYNFLDEVIDAALNRIARQSSYTRDEAIAALQMIDQILIEKNVVYPADTAGMGLVSQLSDGLRGRVMNTAEVQALAVHPHNARRAHHIREHATKAFYVNDCDTTSFIYLEPIREVLESDESDVIPC